MKLMNYALLFLLCFAFTEATWAAALSKNAPVQVADFNQMDTESVLALTPEKFEAENGRKMKFKERVALKMLQKKLKKQAKKKAKDPNKESVYFTFDIVSFLLCLFLSLIGLLIVWLLWGRDRNRLISGAIGVAISIVIFGGVLFGILGG